MIDYEFKCKECGKIKQVTKSIHDPHPTKCECGGELKQRFYTQQDVLYFTEHRGARTPRFK